MSPAAYAITAHAMASALGRTTDEVVAELRAGRSGLSPWGSAQGLPFETWFGHVPGDLDALPASLAAFESRQARLTLHVLRQIEAPVRAAVARWGADRVAVLLGTTTGGVSETEARHAAFVAHGHFPDGYQMARQHVQHAAADMAAAWLGVKGPVMAQATACSSSTKVFGTARRLLDAGVVDAVVAGGVDTHCQMTLLGFHGMEVTTHERCRPFAEGRTGINLGEGGAWVLVERQGEALAWLRGVGESSDAFHMTQPDPDGAGVLAAMSQAIAASGCEAGDVDLVHPHATGTAYNDLSEAKAIAACLPHRPLVIATKGYTGHTLGAAGALGVSTSLVCLSQGWAPASLTTWPLEPGIDLHLEPQTVHRAFQRALVVSAAFAGHNAAVLLEAA